MSTIFAIIHNTFTKGDFHLKEACKIQRNKKSGNDGIKDSYFHMLTAGVSAFKVLSLKFRKYRFNDISYIIKKGSDQQILFFYASLLFIYHVSIHNGEQDFRILNIIRRNLKKIAVHNNHIREFALFQRTQLMISSVNKGRTHCIGF